MIKGLVSICIPNFNNEEYVGFAIESALKQTYLNFEIIVVDNNSLDNSWEVINSFSHPNLVVKKNSNIYKV